MVQWYRNRNVSSPFLVLYQSPEISGVAWTFNLQRSTDFCNKKHLSIVIGNQRTITGIHWNEKRLHMGWGSFVIMNTVTRSKTVNESLLWAVHDNKVKIKPRYVKYNWITFEREQSNRERIVRLLGIVINKFLFPHFLNALHSTAKSCNTL